MILLKTHREISLMREAGIIAARALKLAGEAVAPGVSTAEIDALVRNYIEKQGAIPSFLNYNGFPAAACISINHEVIHGIPSQDRKIKEGDIVSIDLGATLNGFVGDTAATFAAGEISEEASMLCETTKQALYEGLKMAKAGKRLGDIGHAIEAYCTQRGYSVVRNYTGHGIGKQLHEDPPVPNYGKPGRGLRLIPGMTLAIEPMINQGMAEVDLMPDGWTVLTADAKLSAHFEHTIAITKDSECQILTLDD